MRFFLVKYLLSPVSGVEKDAAQDDGRDDKDERYHLLSIFPRMNETSLLMS